MLATTPVSIGLGSIKVAAVKTPGLVVTLSSTVTLALPPPWTEGTTAEELRQASAEGKIWMAKAGGCRVDVESLVNEEGLGSAGLDESVMVAVAGFLEACPVWEHIGLELRTNHAAHAQEDWGHAKASYFLHHPDLSSEMIAPAEVPCAQFQGLRCVVNYDFRPRKRKAPSKKQIVAQAVVKSTNDAPETTEEPSSNAHDVRPKPKRSRKTNVAKKGVATPAPDPLAPNPKLDKGLGGLDSKDTESLVAEAITEMACLLDFAFRKLIGFRGTCPGMRTVRGARSPSLIEIAPAVWDLQYLQMMCLHAQAISAIAAGVARLRNAQSASLRAKLDILTGRGASNDMSNGTGGSEADDVKEVKGRLWLLCQTRIRPEPIKGHQIKRNADQSTTRQPPTELSAEGQKLETPLYHAGEYVGGHNAAEDCDLVVDYGDDSALPDPFVELDYPGIGQLPDSQRYVFDHDEDTPLDDLTPSSEGDYFYTDGQGNVYSVERHDDPQDHHQLEWPSSPPLASSEEFTDEENVEEEDWDAGPNETYIMYHEVQHWPPEPGTPIHTVDASHFLLPPPPHPDDPFNGWAGD